MASDRLKHHRTVGHGPGERSDMVERPGQWQRPETTDAAVGRFQSDCPAETRRSPDGSARIAAEAGGTQAGGNRGRRPAARAAWHAGNIPGVADDAEVRVFAGYAEGELVQVVLAENQRASLFEAADNSGVLGCDVVAQDLGAHRRRHAGEVKEVFDAYRHAVQWAAVIALRDLLFRLRGSVENAVGENGDVGIEGWIEPVDALNIGAGDFTG